MAAKFAGKLTVAFAAIIIIGAVLFYYGRPQNSGLDKSDIDKFVQLYIDMSLVKEMNFFDQDSIRIKYDELYKNADVDSIWITEFTDKLSHHPETQKEIWQAIVSKLDSLKENVQPDTIRAIQSKSAVNADSM